MRLPGLFVAPPRMAHGDADRIADLADSAGLPLVPWQREFLRRIEAASMNEQFTEILRGMSRGGW